MAAPEQGPAGDAIEIFAGWLSRRENGELVGFDELLRAHPQLAPELAELEATWLRLAAASHPAPSSLSLAEQSRSRFGAPEVPSPEPGNGEARGDFASRLIAQLSARSAGFGRYRMRGEVAADELLLGRKRPRSQRQCHRHQGLDTPRRLRHRTTP